jgi:hypothetical protein
MPYKYNSTPISGPKPATDQLAGIRKPDYLTVQVTTSILMRNEQVHLPKSVVAGAKARRMSGWDVGTAEEGNLGRTPHCPW